MQKVQVSNDLIENINSKLQKGLSTEEIAAEMGLKRDALRKRLNRHGYKYNADLNRYELNGDNNPAVIQKATADPASVNKTHSHFTSDEMALLRRMMDEYTLRNNIQGTTVINDELHNRNIRVYKQQYAKFANWCKCNGITQADALYKAIELLMTR